VIELKQRVIFLDKIHLFMGEGRAAFPGIAQSLIEHERCLEILSLSAATNPTVFT